MGAYLDSLRLRVITKGLFTLGMVQLDEVRWGPGRGAFRYQMATHCHTATWSGSSDSQNIRPSTPLKAKRGGRSTSDLAPYNCIRVVACKMCLFSLYFVIHMMF